MRLFILMVVVTSIEVVLIAKIGELIGFWATLSIIILTAFIGSKLLKQQWAKAMQSNNFVQKGASKSILEAVILVICGVLLVTPGFLTDIIGFLMLIPWFRKNLIDWLIDKQWIFNQSKYQGFSFSKEKFTRNDNDILEGEFTRHDNKE